MNKLHRSWELDGSRAWLAVALTALVGAWLRLANLGDLGFRWDEDLSGLAVQAILEKGYPELPSGMVYLRGGLSLYAMALSAQLFGYSELALRLPAALCGIALIPVAYLFARSLFGTTIGVITAAIVSVSIWDIELARYARMYAPFSLSYVVTILCIWKYRVEQESLPGGLLAIALACLTLSLHQLGYTLAAAFFFPLIAAGSAAWRQWRNFVFPVAGAACVGAFFLAWSELLTRYRWRPALDGPEAAPPVPLAAESSLLDDLAEAIPELPLFFGLLAEAPLVLVAGIALLLAAAGLIAARYARAPHERALVLAVAVLCAAQLFNLALLALFALAFSKREGLTGLRRADVVAGVALLVAAFVGWIAIALGLGLADELRSGPALKNAVRALLDYPHFYIFWGFVRESPLLSAVAALGGLWALDRAAQRVGPRPAGGAVQSAIAARFLLLALGTPLIANGLFDGPYELFRYNIPFDTFYFCLIAIAIARWHDLVPAWRPVAIGPATGRLAGTAVLILLTLGFDLNPLRGWLVVQRDYLNDGLLYRAFGIERYDDFKTTAAFVRESAAPEDVILALDSREYFNYLGRLDYWVRSGTYENQAYLRDGTLHDLYVGTPLITGLDQLQTTLRHPKRTKWLIASDGVLGGQNSAVAQEIKDFIRSQQEHVVYVGRDGDRKVYRFD